MFPFPVMISPMVKTRRYFLHLLIFTSSHLCKFPDRNISMINLSLLVACWSGVEWSCRWMWYSCTNFHRCLIQDGDARKCVCLYEVVYKFPGNPTSNFIVSSHNLSICPRIVSFWMLVMYFIIFKVP